jgi:hypothetical protein
VSKDESSIRSPRKREGSFAFPHRYDIHARWLAIADASRKIAARNGLRFGAGKSVSTFAVAPYA